MVRCVVAIVPVQLVQNDNKLFIKKAMKRVKMFALMMCVIMFSMTSCDSEETTPDVDTAAIGDMTISKSTNIATGQNVTFGVSVTTNSTVYATDAVYWYPDATVDVSTKTSVVNGESTFTTSWSSPGAYQVKCVYQYLVGTETCTLTKNYIYVVVKQAHIGNSLLGDSMESVITDNSSLFALSGDTNVMYQNVGDVTYYYNFTDGYLNSGYSLEYKDIPSTDSEKAAYGYLMLDYVNTAQYVINTDDVSYFVQYSSGYVPTADELEAIAEFESGANITGTTAQTTLGAAVNNGDMALCFSADIVDDSTVEYATHVSYSATQNKYMVYTIIQNK